MTNIKVLELPEGFDWEPINTAKLYCWRPDGHGPLTFFVVAESEESAKAAVALEVQKIVEDEHGSDWSVSGWPDDGYKLEIYEPGVVAVNDND